MTKQYNEYVRIDNESGELPSLLPIENLGIHEPMQQTVTPVPIRPVTNDMTCEMKKLTRGFCKAFLIEIKLTFFPRDGPIWF